MIENKVSLYSYSITKNHVHILAHVDSRESVARMMNLASSVTARNYNRREEKTGAFWEHQYHCTIVETGQHLLNCINYIHLNMVRAGAVQEPAKWAWCSHDEIMEKRSRYKMLDLDRLHGLLGGISAKELHESYCSSISAQISMGNLQRSQQWTEALAVGSKSFIESVSTVYTDRMKLDKKLVSDQTTDQEWAIFEENTPYRARKGGL